MTQQGETKLKEKVLAWLAGQARTWTVKIQQVGIRGTPDILVCWHGRFVALELKTDKGRVDKLQAANLDFINQAGGLGLVVRQGNWKETLDAASAWAQNPETLVDAISKFKNKDHVAAVLAARQEIEKLRRILLWASYNVTPEAKTSAWYKQIVDNAK